ncbi:hypothetical protein BgiMline_021523 [Biomphalaria glabrata]
MRFGKLCVRRLANIEKNFHMRWKVKVNQVMLLVELRNKSQMEEDYGKQNQRVKTSWEVGEIGRASWSGKARGETSQEVEGRVCTASEADDDVCGLYSKLGPNFSALI